ncbi:four helix bundle protein [Flavobacterium salilacus subsp. salilacus]|uniref:four helix bundle protein n=1 Tax=Flavobacterium TaxID=237 RepID=UPI0010751E00|nr:MULTISPECIES: four helix bundle protein [Flavobacterium]KAF2518604.1 four helix bundle protein [Flavobacterium salilacus subsp. salilacus]MBE1613561.1 four helix bundle protein [Flavobacterium sp. SaA2.13]
MKTDNVIQQKSYVFAIRIVKLYKYLVEDHKEFVLSKQLLRSGTSIGANVEEAIGGQSRKDFASKLAIAYKEGRETHYWLRLLHTGYLNESQFNSLIANAEELLKIMGSIQKTIHNS